jgi:hypothetical protein
MFARSEMRGQFNTLSPQEKREVKILEAPRAPIPTFAASSSSSDEDEDDAVNNDTPKTRKRKTRAKTAEAAEKKLKAKRLENGEARQEAQSKYIDCDFILGTNNTVERLFSRAKRVLTDARAGMTPYMFEVIMFLKINQDLWGVHDVADAIKMLDSDHTRNDREQRDDAES